MNPISQYLKKLADEYGRKINFVGTPFNDEGLDTVTSREQKTIECHIEIAYRAYFEQFKEILLFRDKHVEYLKSSLFRPLAPYLSVWDTSRTWMVYWISLSLYLLGESRYLKENSHKIISFLKHCESPKGGYGGAPGQEPHLASTYAAVHATVTIGNNIAFDSLNRVGLKNFLQAMQQPDGSFTLHEHGEIDIRGIYCALSCAKLLKIPIFNDDDQQQSQTSNLFENSAQWILSCQTYEGGFGAAPGHEAHGGYTFCGVASLVLLDQLHLCDLNSLLRWVSNKQRSFEGGFCGRTNKLVDGCYSFWNGATMPIIQQWLTRKKNLVFDRWLFNQEALQEYILVCCQTTVGGLVDKPTKHPDFYHTCYALSGLSIAQHSMNSRIVIGSPDNLLEPINPIFNVPLESLGSLKDYWETQNDDDDDVQPNVPNQD